MTKAGEMVAEPLFWFQSQGRGYPCFGSETPRQRTVQRTHDVGFSLLKIGEEVPGLDS
jgi:hypothetical protein